MSRIHICALDALLALLAAILAAAYVAVPVALLQCLTRAAGRYSFLRSSRTCHLPGPSLASRRACPVLAALAAVPVACRASCCASCDCHHARRTCNEPRLSPSSTPRLSPLWSRGRRACLAGRAGRRACRAYHCVCLACRRACLHVGRGCSAAQPPLPPLLPSGCACRHCNASCPDIHTAFSQWKRHFFPAAQTPTGSNLRSDSSVIGRTYSTYLH